MNAQRLAPIGDRAIDIPSHGGGVTARAARLDELERQVTPKPRRILR
jgi:hypothetical protein